MQGMCLQQHKPFLVSAVLWIGFVCDLSAYGLTKLLGEPEHASKEMTHGVCLSAIRLDEQFLTSSQITFLYNKVYCKIL
jgi:hypothetical protein